MEGFISCLAQSPQPKHISRIEEPDSIPTTLLNSRVSLRRCPSLGPVAWWLVTHKHVSSMIPGTRPAFAWALSNHARTTPWASPANVSCYTSNQGYDLLCSTSTVMRRTPGTNVQTMLPLLVHLVQCRNQNIRTHWIQPSFDSTSLIAPCDNLDDALQVIRNARTAHLPAPQRLARSQRSVSHRVSLLSVSVSVSVLLLDPWFVFDSVNADAPLQLNALFDNGGTRYLFHFYLLVLAHLSGSR